MMIGFIGLAIYGRYNISLVMRNLNVIGYALPTIQTTFLFWLTQWLVPSRNEAIFFGLQKLVFVVQLMFVALIGTSRHVKYATVLVCMMSWASAYVAFDDRFVGVYGKTSVMVYVNKWAFIHMVIHYMMIGWVLSRKTKELEALDSDIRNIWIPKVIAGAYQNMIKPDGYITHGHYSILSLTRFPDKYIGADYVRCKAVGDDMIVLVGDVVSHGLNVTPGASLCMNVLSVLRTRNPRRVIEGINAALLDIDKENGGETLAICLRLRPDGTVVYNGLLDKICIVRMATGEEEKVECNGRFLGKDPGYIVPPSHTIKLNPGDNLVVLTDGAANRDRDDDQTSVVISYNLPPFEESQNETADLSTSDPA